MMRSIATACALASLMHIACGAERPDAPSSGTPVVPKSAGPSPRISISKNAPDTGPSATLRAGHRALRAGEIDAAAHLYLQLERFEPRNIDVLLGLAAVAHSLGNLDEARFRYEQVLRAEPSHALAHGALLALFPDTDPASAETRFKAMIARDPSPFLYHALGNLYAGRSLWPQARDAYTQAHRLDPRNPDHAYNVAVSSEHTGHASSAARYYRHAASLARTRHTEAFVPDDATTRAARLEARQP